MIKIGDIIVVKNDSRFMSKLIRYFTQSDYSHAGIVIDVITEDKKKCVSVIESGLLDGVHYSLREYDEQKYEFYSHVGLVETKRQTIKQLAIDELGIGYDFKGMLYRAWLLITLRRTSPNKWDDKGKFYCSEFVSDCFGKIGLTFNAKIPIDNILPSDIAESKFTREVKWDD